MASLDNNPQKRRRPDDSPDEICKNVDVCRHCNKKCTKKSEAVQCDLCYSWLHASCEGLTKEQYKLLTQLTSSVDNVMYYCKSNKCETRSKQLMFNSIHKTLFSPHDSETEESEPYTLEQDAIRKEISDLTTKVNTLCSMNENLEKEIKSAVSLMATGSVPATQSASESSTTPNQTDTASSISMSSTSETLTILDELADRERRCKNLIVYNLEEDSEANSDESMLQELFSSVFNLDVVLTKTVRLGRRNDSKPRPLLACFADTPMRNMILSYSGKLQKFVFQNHWILLVKA